MNPMIDMWNSTADAWNQRYEQIADQWEAGTPCSEFSVKQLCEHAAGAQAGIMGGLGMDVPEDAEWPAVYEAVKAGMTPDALEGTIDHPMMGTVPKMRMIGIAISDLLVHTWDLSRGLGVDDTLPEAPVAATYEGLQQFPPEVMRAPGMFGAPVEVADDASVQDQMIAFAGRQP